MYITSLTFFIIIQLLYAVACVAVRDLLKFVLFLESNLLSFFNCKLNYNENSSSRRGNDCFSLICSFHCRGQFIFVIEIFIIIMIIIIIIIIIY